MQDHNPSEEDTDLLRQPEWALVSALVWPKAPGLKPASLLALESALESVSPQNSLRPPMRSKMRQLDKAIGSSNEESSSNVGQGRSFKSAPMLQIQSVLAS